MLKLSIVTICYNDADGLYYTLKSISNAVQIVSGHQIELIVIDGGSKDGTCDVLDEWESLIDIVVSEPDDGLYDAMNKGLSLAHGEHLMFVNAGDGLLSEGFSDVLKSIKSNITYCSRVTVISEFRENKWVFPNASVNSENFSNWSLTHAVNLQGCFFPKAFYQSFKLDQRNFIISADMKFIAQARDATGLQFIDVISGKFFLGGVSNNYAKFSDALNHSYEASTINCDYYRGNRLRVFIKIHTTLKFLMKFFVARSFGVQCLRKLSGIYNVKR
jgi:glycosyltransferase involved in cell wall biosynthesis